MSSLVINSRVYSTYEKRFEQAKLDTSIKNISIREIHVDEEFVQAIQQLLTSEGGNGECNSDDDGNGDTTTNNSNKHTTATTTATPRQWERINICNVTGQVNSLIQVVSLDLENVERLVFSSNNERIEHTSLTELGSKLSYNKSLKYLRLQIGLVASHSTMALMDGLKYTIGLQHLHLRESTFSPEACTCLINALSNNTSLCILELDGCNLSGIQVSQICESLERHPKLEYLNLSQNGCDSTVTMYSIASLLLSEGNVITKLDLSKQQLLENSKLDLNVLSNALISNTRLVELNLCNNHISDIKDIECLAISLVTNSTLQKLMLNGNEITNDGIKLFSKYIPKMKGLKELWIYDNSFDVVGAECLLHAVTSNFVLEKVYIARSHNEGDEMMDYQKKILFYMCLNLGGRELLLQDESKKGAVPPSLWPYVFERTLKMIKWGPYVDRKSAQADVIFFLLKGPALFER